MGVVLSPVLVVRCRFGPPEDTRRDNDDDTEEAALPFPAAVVFVLWFILFVWSLRWTAVVDDVVVALGGGGRFHTEDGTSRPPSVSSKLAHNSSIQKRR